MKLSAFTNAINDMFDSNIAIPNGADYSHIRKVLGDEFESTISNFKKCSHHAHRINALDPVAMSTDLVVNGKRLTLIEFQETSKIEKDGSVIFANGSLPSVKFTKLESETFSLFHELGHAIDDDIRIPMIENETTDEINRYWLRENFADFFSSLMLIKAAGSTDFVTNRILPFRALSNSYKYQTTGAINWALDTAEKIDIHQLSELQIKQLAISEWNKGIFNKVSSLYHEAKKNIVSIKILTHCIDKGGPEELLRAFEAENHATILDHMKDFNSKYLRPLAANAYAFTHPLKELTKLQLVIAQPLSDLLSGIKREQKFDERLLKYLSKYPQCPLVARSAGQKISFEI
jgi:hypothetical protein